MAYQNVSTSQHNFLSCGYEFTKKIMNFVEANPNIFNTTHIEYKVPLLGTTTEIKLLMCSTVLVDSTLKKHQSNDVIIQIRK